MFNRPHHQRIAHILSALDGDVLTQHRCWFGGGTCIALRFGEFRESMDIDFLVSDPNGYRELRHMLTGPEGFARITRSGAMPLVLDRDVRSDGYGIRTRILMDGHPVKFEIVREARIELLPPGPEDQLCGVPTLTVLDLAASKLLANSDRYADDGAFNRDVIDLAMMNLSRPSLRLAMVKARQAYGDSVGVHLSKAIDRIEQRSGWLERCMQVMSIQVPKAVLWQKIRRLRFLTQ